MDNGVYEKDTIQDEEIYALLQQAMEQERLCVSEELIQKTLRRVQEADNAAAVPISKAGKKPFYGIKYACVAAAAVLVLLAGSKVFDAGKLFTKNNAEYSVQEEGIDGRSGGNAGINKSKSGNVANEMAEVQDKVDACKDAADFEGTESEEYITADSNVSVTNHNVDAYMEAGTVSLSSAIQSALSEAGYEPVADEAEYWVYVKREVDWKQELVQELEKQKPVVNTLSENATYRYPLKCNNGENKLLLSEVPLDLIVRFKTEQGILWYCTGEKIFFYAE